MTSGGNITYSFHPNIGKISTHSANKVNTKSFEDLGENPIIQIEKALNEWRKYGNFKFTRLDDNSEADINFRVAEIEQGAIGYPNYRDELCSQISGNIIYSNARRDPHRLFILTLHETGHVLGLGHISSKAIMNPSSEKYAYSGLQPNDIKGILSIYGEQINEYK